MTNKNGVSIVGVVGIMLILSMLGLAAVSLLGTASSAGLDYMQSQQAFYIAEAGKAWYLEQLMSDSDWSDNAATGDKGPKNFAGGAFAITVANSAQNSIDVTSTGTLTGYEGQNIQRKVAVHVTKTSTPLAFNYALYVGGTVNTNNAEDLVITGQQLQNATFFPVVDFSYYESIAGHKVYANKSFAAGTYSGIWYVNGNVTFASNVTLNGTIIATGNIDMSNTDHVTVNPDQPYPALVANGNFLFQNSEHMTINGLVFVGADLTGNLLAQNIEDANVFGTVIVAGNFNLQNSEHVTITYNPLILASPPPGFSGGGGTQTITTTNWYEALS